MIPEWLVLVGILVFSVAAAIAVLGLVVTINDIGVNTRETVELLKQLLEKRR